MANTDDIRTTGPVGLKGLSEEQRRRIQESREQASLVYRNHYNPSLKRTSTVQRYSPDEAMSSWGTSSYDAPVLSQNLTQGELQDARYENQPWYDVVANGVGKMLGTAATTFVSSLVGIPAGLGSVAASAFDNREGIQWSGLWNNVVTNTLGDVDKWMEKNMTNYQSQEQQENPNFRFGDMNWWADNVIKNAGFTLGAAASMAVGSGSLGLISRAFGAVNEASKGAGMAGKFASALMSATGEGMIEARNGVEERNKLETQRLEDSLAPEMQALEQEFNLINEEYAATRGQSLYMGADGQAHDPAFDIYDQKIRDLYAKRDVLNQKLEAGKRQIEESGREMGNKILLGNQALLTAGNLIQFGKLMNKSFDNARHAAEITAKTSKPLGVKAVKADTDALRTGYKITGKNLGRVIAAGKGFITEGSEEMNQQWIQSSAGAAYNEKDVNDYWRAKLDPDSYRETTKGLYSLGNIISQGFNESWGDRNQWEQFLIGGITGMAGSYAPTKIFNQNKTKSRWNPGRYGSWKGGIVNELKDFNKEYNQYEENVEDLNKILAQENFEERTRNLIAHSYLENQKEDAALAGDMKRWKDEDDKQAIHDIQAFLRAGKIDDLRAIYEEMGKDMSDEDIQGIIKATTQEISADRDKQNHDDAIDAKIADHRAKIEELNAQANKIAEDAGMLETGEEVSAYNNSVQPAIEKLYEDVDKEYAAIDELEQQKQNYAGQTRYNSPYLNEDGSQRKSNDEIREEIKHNSEEMNRKLDSYLDSVEEVNRRTGGNLTKDQEDNLAYLHNMGKTSINRADRIVEDIRKDLPNKFLFKTTKTPEQLAKEYASSDLAFTKDDDTPEGYVSVDTSMLAGHNFTDFLIRDILWGRNQRPEFGETADERAAREEEEKNLSDEERNKRRTVKEQKKYEEAKKNAQEQNMTNLQLIMSTFENNYKKNNRATDAETGRALNSFVGNIIDAAGLMKQAGEFEKTLTEYTQNPQKVDEAKAKEEEKANKKNKEEDQKSKFAGKTAKDINQDIANGDLSIDDVDDFLGADLSDVTDEDSKSALENAKQEAQKSKDIRQKQAEVKGAILNNAEENGWGDAAVDAALNAVDTMAANAEDAADINLDNVGDFINPADVEGASTGDDEMADLSQQVEDMIASGLNSWKESQDKKEDIPDPSTAVSIEDEPEDTGHDSTTKMPAETAAPKVSSTENKDEWEQPVPTNSLTSSALDNIVEELGKLSDNSTQGNAWRSTTRRFGRKKGNGGRYYTTNVPYHELISDKNSIRYKRSKAIWEYLDAQGAWDRVDNAGKDRLKAGDSIHFMVRNLADEIFGRSFEDLNDKERPQALVILMLDSNGEILGDLPLAELEPGYNEDESKITSPSLKSLISAQNMLFKAFEEKRSKTSCNEAVADKGLTKDGAENLNLTFNNRTKSPFVSKVSQVLNGVVPFGGEINILNDIMGNEDLLLGVSVTGETIATSRDKKDRRGGAARPIRVGNIGQSYLLLPSSSGALIPVPFYTRAFNTQAHANTQLYRILSEAIANLIDTAGKNETSAYKENMDIIEGLLQVRAQEGAKSTVELTKDNITLHLQSLTNPDQHIDITVPNAGSRRDVTDTILRQLDGTPINVSLQFLNSKIGAKNGISAPYNRVIGEIADANLPKNTTHTQNNWFTIKLATQEGTKRNEVRYQQSGTQTFNVGDKTVKIDIDKFIAYEVDPVTKTETLIEGDEEVNNLLAEIKASQQSDKTKPFKIELDGQIRTYDPVKKEFIRTSQGSGVNAGEASINQQKEDRKNGNTGNNERAVSIEDGTQENNVAVQQQPTENPTQEIQTPQQPVERKAKTIEEINKEVGEAGIINKRNKDAWNAISDSLKLKMVNEGTGIVLEYGGNEVTLDYRDFEQMKDALKEANKYAKSGSMIAREGTKYRRVTTEQERKANIRREKEWLQKNLPMFSTEERLHLIQGLLEIPGEKNWAWGRFEKGIITLSDRAARGTLYHEAFHAVTQTLLSDDELNDLYDAAVKHYKETDVAYVEELLAEDFRRYVQMEETPVLGPIRRFFRKIMNAIRNLSGYRAPIQELFYRINNGEFSESIPRKPRSGNAFYQKYYKYQDRVEESLAQMSHPLAKSVIQSFYNWPGLLGEPGVTGDSWRSFKNYWKQKHVIVEGEWRHKAIGKKGYALNDIWVDTGDAILAIEEIAGLDADRKKKKEEYAARQALKGLQEAQKWQRLTRAQIEALDEADISKEMWDNMSVNEQEQWLNCH